MNTFQRLKFENSSFYQKIRKHDASPEVQGALRQYNELKNKFFLQLDVKIANYDFDGAIELLHEEIQMLERAVYKLKEIVEYDRDGEESVAEDDTF